MAGQLPSRRCQRATRSQKTVQRSNRLSAHHSVGLQSAHFPLNAGRLWNWPQTFKFTAGPDPSAMIEMLIKRPHLRAPYRCQLELSIGWPALTALHAIQTNRFCTPLTWRCVRQWTMAGKRQVCPRAQSGWNAVCTLVNVWLATFHRLLESWLAVRW